jgi:hypothetical protein
MNPDSNREAPIQLPAPAEQLSAPNNGEQQVQAPEAAPSGEHSAQAAPAAMPMNIPLPTPPVMPPASSTPATNNDNPAQASDDSDLIEKEWVSKAKSIVQRTKDDPYQQAEELTVYKADYMKKRYNRAVKLSK